MKTFTPLLASCSLILLHPCAFSAEAWTYGVSKESGWVDYNKSWDGDDDLCWAASASNMITWWQTNSEYAKTYAAESTPTESQVWDAFRASFTNAGGEQYYGYQWFLTGDYTINPEEYDPADPPATLIQDSVYSGGYYSSMFKSSGYTIDSFAVVIDEDDDTSYSSLYYYYSASIVDYLNDGYGISLGINNMGGTDTENYPAWGMGHAITLWGCEYEKDTDGNIIVTALYITDSDDGTTALQRVECAGVEGTNEDGTEVYLSFKATYYDDTSDPTFSDDVGYLAITGLTVLSLVPVDSVPEPSTSVLLFAVVLPFAMRRRRG